MTARHRQATASGRTATPPATAWCSCRSPCRCRTTRSPRAPPSSSPNKMGMDPALVVHAKPMGPDFTFFVVYGRVNHLVDTSTGRGGRAGLPAADAQGGQRDRQARAAPPAGRRRRLHRHRRAHRRHRRDPQHQGVRGGEGPGVLPGAEGGEPRRPGVGARSWWSGRVAEKADAVLVSQVVTQRDAHLLNTREMSAAFREAYPGRAAAAAGRRRAAVRRGDGRRARRRPRLRPGHDARRGGQLPRAPDHRQQRRRARPADDGDDR